MNPKIGQLTLRVCVPANIRTRCKRILRSERQQTEQTTQSIDNRIKQEIDKAPVEINEAIP
ncbi:hypothetical protein [Noviherbaspirillum sp.]|uniref:hypothetical protein n=1 Tax=Noviherbaspirillum sp. TaxID=1926288 RepID=UPI002FE0AAB6